MSAALDRLARGALVLAGLSLLLIALVQAWQVYARYVLNDSPGWTEPVALLLMNTAMMFGAAVGVRRDQHFSFTLLVDAAGPAAQRLLKLLSAVVMGAIGGALTWGGTLLMIDDWQVPMAGAPIPEGLRYLPLSLGGALIGLFALERMVGVARPPGEAGGKSIQTRLDPPRPTER
jgi:TRAP-type C4-dicarboxylate transport system permease small subunit